jgi:iron(III) transport system permease protein
MATDAVTRRRRLTTWSTGTVAIVSAAAFAVPFLYLAFEALRRPGVWDAVVEDSTIDALGRSMKLAIIVTLLATVIGVLLAWLTMRTDLPGRRFWRVAAALPLVIPSFVGAHAYISMMAPGGLLEQAFGWQNLPEVRGLGGAVFVLTALTYPYVYLPVAARLSALPPSYEEAARILGRPPRSMFTSVVLPQTAPSIISGALLVLLYCLSDFGAVNFVQYDTLTRKIFEAKLDPARSVAFSLVLGVLAIGVAGGERLARRRFPVVAGVSGKKSVQYRLGRLRVVALAATATIIGVALVVPIAVLSWWVVRGRRSGGRRSRATDLPDVTWSSTWISVVTAVIAVAVVFPLAVVLARHRSKIAGAASTVVMGGFALPGIVIALALVQMFAGTAAYQTYSVLIVAYLLHFGGQALGATQGTVGAVPRRLHEAARLLGAGRIRRLVNIDVRLMASGLAAAGGLVMLSVLKELPVTLMLRPIGFNTLATRINGTVEEALLVDAGQLSLVLIALSAVLTWLLVLRSKNQV